MKKFGIPLPDDAVLSEIQPVFLTNIKTGEKKVQSYLLYYTKYVNGTKISGPGADGIVIEIDAEGISYYKRLWRNYNLGEGEEEKIDSKGNRKKKHGNKISKEQLLDEEEALVRNADKILSAFRLGKGSLTINNVSLVYKATPFDADENIAVPAWEYSVDRSVKVYVNAITGELIY